MTYLTFHLLFIAPPIALLALLLRRERGANPGDGRPFLHLGAVILLAVVYTTPWDNYLVWRGVWWYGEDRVLATIGYVPVEEYLFFILQPVLTGLWFFLVARRLGPDRGNAGLEPAERRRMGVARVAGAGLYFVLAAAGALLLTSRSGTYLGLILAWAAPVLGLQWAYAGHQIAARWRLFLTAVVPPTLYLWIADATAIHLGIWRISPEFTLGLAAGPLPIEEATFFLITNLLIVQGLMLFRYPPGAGRSAPVGGA